jgi:predicted nucleic acid-binding Zn ribbon protein
LDNSIDISHLKTKTSKKLYLENPKHCKHCGKEIPYEKRENDFCNSSCAASFNNKGVCKHGQKKPDHSYCLNCGKEITRGRHFCDNTCYAEYERKQYVERWKRGEETGIIGEDGIATAVRKYMFEKNNNSCEICGWHEVNPYTGLVPL